LRADIQRAHAVVPYVVNRGKSTPSVARLAYIEKRKTGLSAWSRYVESLVRPGQQNVVRLVVA